MRQTLCFPALDRGLEGLDGRLVIQPADRTVHRLRRAAAPQRDHRGAAGERLDRNDPEVLFAGKQERPAAAVMVADDLVGLPAQELDRRPGQGFQPRAFRAGPNHDQPAAQSRARRDGLVDSLVRHQRGDNQVEIFPAPRVGGRRVEFGVNGRRNDDALAVVALRDALADGLGNRHEVRHPPGGPPVPLAKLIEQRPRQGAADGTLLPAFQVGVAPLPRIPHGREAIADVRNPARHAYRLGHAVAEADDQIHVLWPPRAGRQRHDRKHVPIVSEDSRHALQGRRADDHRLDGRTGRSPAMNQRIENGLGKRLAEDLQALLPRASRSTSHAPARREVRTVPLRTVPPARRASGAAPAWPPRCLLRSGCWLPCRPPAAPKMACVRSSPRRANYLTWSEQTRRFSACMRLRDEQERHETRLPKGKIRPQVLHLRAVVDMTEETR